jgi:hypothetical protein
MPPPLLLRLVLQTRIDPGLRLHLHRLLHQERPLHGFLFGSGSDMLRSRLAGQIFQKDIIA